MSLHLSSVLPGRVYSRSSNRRSTLYRRIINLGSRADCTSPLCLKPSKNGAGGRGEVWVRYETVIGGVMLVRSCSREAFARWAEKSLPDDAIPRVAIQFEPVQREVRFSGDGFDSGWIETGTDKPIRTD